MRYSGLIVSDGGLIMIGSLVNVASSSFITSGDSDGELIGNADLINS